MLVTLDLDGCLVDFPSGLARKLSTKLKREFRVSEMTKYNIEGFIPSQLWTWANKLMRDPKFYERCPPMEGARECIRNISTMCDLYVVTARPECSRAGGPPNVFDATVRYVREYFPEIKEVISAQGPNKIPILLEYMPAVHLDDKPNFVIDAANLNGPCNKWNPLSKTVNNIISCVFDQPYNCNLPDTSYPALTRIFNFKQFEDLIKDLWLKS